MGEIAATAQTRQQVWIKIKKHKLGLSSAKLSRVKYGCLEVLFEVVSEDNLK